MKNDLRQFEKNTIFRNNEHVHLSDQGKRALAAEFDKFIDRQLNRQNPLQKVLETQHVTQLLPALERGVFLINLLYVKILWKSFLKFFFKNFQENNIKNRKPTIEVIYKKV